MPRRAKNGGRGGGVGGNHTRGVGGLDPALHPGTRGSQSNVTCQSYYLSIICENCVEFSTARSVYLKSNARSPAPAVTNPGVRSCAALCRDTHHSSDTTHKLTHCCLLTAHCSNCSHTSVYSPYSRTHTNNGEVDTLDSTRVRAVGSTHNRSFRNSEIRKRSPRATPRHGPHSATLRANEEQRGGVLRGKRACSPQVVTCPNLAPLLQALRREGHKDGLLRLPLLHLPVLHRLPHEAARHERVLKLHPFGVRG